MRYFTAVKTIEIDYGHRIPNHTSKCRNVHGHRGKIEIHVEGELIPEGDGYGSEGMVIDFGDIKRIADEEITAKLDHCFVVAESDGAFKKLLISAATVAQLHQTNFGARYFVDGFGWIQEVPCVPTAENLAYLCWKVLTKRFAGTRVLIEGVRFWETPNSCADYFPGTTDAVQMSLGEAHETKAKEG